MQVTKIKPQSGWISINWRELFQYKELLFFWFGVTSWFVINRLCLGGFLMLVFSVIFGKLAKIDSEGFPYTVYVYAGLLLWAFFANSITQAGLSLVNQQNLLTKIYFPRLFVPTANVGASLVDLLLSCNLHLLHTRS